MGVGTGGREDCSVLPPRGTVQPGFPGTGEGPSPATWEGSRQPDVGGWECRDPGPAACPAPRTWGLQVKETLFPQFRGNVMRETLQAIG